MAVVFFVMAGMAALWTCIKTQAIYLSIVDTFPPQFQDKLSSRYAFPVLVLSPSTPLPLQEEYVKSTWGGCAFFLCVSLGFFFARNVVFGGALLAVFVGSVFAAIKCWKTYKSNRERKMVQDETEAT
jgi:hypothetical protein